MIALTISAFTFEYSGASLFMRLGHRETFVTRDSAQPFWWFAKDFREDATEFWGLGFHLIIDHLGAVRDMPSGNR